MNTKNNTQFHTFVAPAKANMDELRKLVQAVNALRGG
jgi:hypothetical protein